MVIALVLILIAITFELFFFQIVVFSVLVFIVIPLWFFGQNRSIILVDRLYPLIYQGTCLGFPIRKIVGGSGCAFVSQEIREIVQVMLFNTSHSVFLHQC